MRKEIQNLSECLFYNKWVSLYEMVKDNSGISGYIFSHETRSGGDTVAILPTRKTKSGIEYLLRFEAVPCWEVDTVIPCSLTGGFEKDLTLKGTVNKELLEESGYDVPIKSIKYIGDCYGTKSTDTVYHLYTVDLTGLQKEKPLTVESELEKLSYCKWVDEDFVKETKDPIVSILYLRISNEKIYN